MTPNFQQFWNLRLKLFNVCKILSNFIFKVQWLYLRKKRWLPEIEIRLKLVPFYAISPKILNKQGQYTFLKYSRASSLIIHKSAQSWIAVKRTPWCFSLSREATGFTKFSARSGTFFIILIEHNAACTMKGHRKYLFLILFDILMKTEIG